MTKPFVIPKALVLRAGRMDATREAERSVLPLRR
jgi:hypothetical protein